MPRYSLSFVPVPHRSSLSRVCLHTRVHHIHTLNPSLIPYTLAPYLRSLFHAFVSLFPQRDSLLTNIIQDPYFFPKSTHTCPISRPSLSCIPVPRLCSFPSVPPYSQSIYKKTYTPFSCLGPLMYICFTSRPSLSPACIHRRKHHTHPLIPTLSTHSRSHTLVPYLRVDPLFYSFLFPVSASQPVLPRVSILT